MATTLPRLLEIAAVPGIGIGVLRKGQPVWQAHTGIRDLRTKTAATATTLWKAASLSKQATAYTALRMADAGTLDLDRPLADYLGDAAPANEAARRITARHVLTHSSGLPNWRRTAELVPDFKPGTRFRYSGEGFFYLARCMERIRGAGFESLMQADVFSPLGMASSTFLWRADFDTRLATGYRWEQEPWIDLPWIEDLHRKLSASRLPPKRWALDTIAKILAPSSGAGKDVPPLPGSIYYPNPAMSLITTVGDYLTLMTRFLSSVNDGTGLSSNLRHRAAQPAIKVNSVVSWGLGWGVEETEGQSYLFQQGSIASACTSFMLLHPASESGLVVFTNHQNGLRVIERIARETTGHDHPLFLLA
jgi:CubicO group peptidase (beta-lactamase class C family)